MSDTANDPVRLLIVYYSRSGSVEALAAAAADAARETGAEVRTRRAREVAGAFATASWPHGGSEVVTLSLYAPMAHLGMVIVPPGYTDEAMLEAGSPYGASAIVGAENRDPRSEDFDAIRHQSRRMVAIARALVAADEMPSRSKDN